MPEPTICVALDSTNLDDMVDEAARASTAGADLVEVRFDRLYLSKPDPVMVEQEEGEPKSVMPPEAEWPIADVSSVDCLLYTSPSPRDLSTSRMPSSA